MAGSDWVFDRPPASGARIGGTAANYVFAPTLDTFVREVLQNAHDQRLAHPGSARVDLDLVELGGSHRVALLDAIAFDRLRRHLDGIARERYKLGRQVGDALSRLDDPTSTLRILRVTDRFTEGLTGGEDERGENFNGLCRDVLVNTDPTAGKGGSYGLGKAVLWRFSALSTVLFSSTVPASHHDRSALRLRAFGRADLAFHETGEDPWAGPGWFGRPTVLGNGARAESLWDDEAAEVTLALGGHDLSSTTTGTTVAVVAFAEPGADRDRDPDEVVDDLAVAARRWFWPAMTRTPASLEVTVGLERDGVTVRRELVDAGAGSSRALVATAGAGDLQEHAVAPGDVARRTIPLVVPARRDINKGVVAGTVELRVRRCDDDEADLDGTKRVALVRGAGMVVEHRRPRRAPTDGGAYHAVLLAGLARGDTAADEAVEAFLRAAEPPAHNRWVHDTDMVRNDYRAGAKKQLDAMWKAIDEALVEIADPAVPAREPGPPALARLFTVGSAGDPDGADHLFDIRPTGDRLVDGVWTIELRVRRLRVAKPWRLDLSVWLDAESGRGEPVTLSGLTADVPIEVARQASHRVHIELLADHAEAALTLTVPLNGRSSRSIRNRLRLDARPAIREPSAG